MLGILDNGVRALTPEAARQMGKVYLNTILRYTAPNNPTLDQGGGRAPQGVKRLKRRIARDWMGAAGEDGAEPSTTGPVAKVFRRRDGTLVHGPLAARAYLPVIIPAWHVPGLALQPVDGVMKASRMRMFGARHGVYHRFLSSVEHEPVYTSRAMIMSAVRELQKKAGTLISGWAPAARFLGIATMERYFPARNGSGSCRGFWDQGVYEIEFGNNVSYPGSARVGGALAESSLVQRAAESALAKQRKNIEAWMAQKLKELAA